MFVLNDCKYSITSRAGFLRENGYRESEKSLLNVLIVSVESFDQLGNHFQYKT